MFGIIKQITYLYSMSRKEYLKQYYLKNKEKIKATALQSYYQNPEQAKKNATQWRLDNPEKVKIAVNKWAKNNPEYIKQNDVNHRLKYGIGVYGLWNKIVQCWDYVGEGQLNGRKSNHKNAKSSSTPIEVRLNILFNGFEDVYDFKILKN